MCVLLVVAVRKLVITWHGDAIGRRLSISHKQISVGSASGGFAIPSCILFCSSKQDVEALRVLHHPLVLHKKPLLPLVHMSFLTGTHKTEQ